MGRHARQAAGADTSTVALHTLDGSIGLYPQPGETAEDVARWLDRSWAALKVVAMDERLFGLMPYCDEIGSKPAIDPRTGRRRGSRRRLL